MGSPAPGQCHMGRVPSSALGTQNGEEKGETEDHITPPLEPGEGKHPRKRVERKPHLGLIWAEREGCLQRFKGGGPCRQDSVKWELAPPPSALYIGRGKFLNCFLLSSCPFAGGALVSAFPRGRARPKGLPHSVCLVWPQFPYLTKSPGQLTSRGMCAGGRRVQRGMEKEEDLGRSGPWSSSQPQLPYLPSPALHPSRPDNGTSPGGACAMSPGPSAGEGAGAPERGRGATRRKQGGVGSAQSRIQGREARGGPRAAARVFKITDVPHPQGLHTTQQRQLLP